MLKRKAKKQPPMTQAQHLHRIETADRRFRWAQTVFMLLALIAFVAVLAYEVSITRQLQHQVSSANKGLSAAIKQVETDQDKQTKYINCLAQLFGSRPNQVIPEADFNKCLNGALIIHDNTVTDPSGTTGNLPNTSQSGSQTGRPSQSNNPDNSSLNKIPVPPKHPLVCTVTLGLLGCK